MRRLPAALLLGGAVLVAAVLGWAGRFASAPPPDVSGERAPVPQISVGLQEATLVLRHKGARQAEIHARRVTVSRDLRSARFAGVTSATVYVRSGEALQVSASEILLDRETNNLEIRGPVVITSSRGYRLAAPEAQWRDARQEVIFPRGVQVRRGGQRLQAGRLVVDAALTSFDLSGGVQIVFHLEGMRP